VGRRSPFNSLDRSSLGPGGRIPVAPSLGTDTTGPAPRAPKRARITGVGGRLDVRRGRITGTITGLTLTSTSYVAR